MSKKIDQSEATSWLQDGALGVGEDHQNDAARVFTKNLIEQGHVKALFLECDSSKQTDFDEAVKRSKNSSDYESSIENIVDAAGPQWFGAGLTLGAVAVAAVNKGVPVYFIDLEMFKKTTKPNPALRDTHAAELFDKITAPTGRAGSLVLFGNVHLDRAKDPINKYYFWDDKCLGDRVDLGLVLF